MARINITERQPDEFGEYQLRLVGWFDPDKATTYGAEYGHNGEDMVSVATGREHFHEVLYRTAGGRWVLNSWSDWAGAPQSYRFVGDDRAREWLLIAKNDEGYREHFGEIPEEEGPQPVQVAYPDGTTADGMSELHMGTKGQQRLHQWAEET